MLFKKHTQKDSVWTGFNKQCITKHRAQQRLSKNPPPVPLGGDNLADSRADRSELLAFGFQNLRPQGRMDRTLETEMRCAVNIFK